MDFTDKRPTGIDSKKFSCRFLYDFSLSLSSVIIAFECPHHVLQTILLSESQLYLVFEKVLVLRLII